MGDEFRKCPECSERLSPDARQCVCGWGKKTKIEHRRHDMICTWNSGAMTCSHPVGQFREGATSGFCIFHRSNSSGSVAYNIASESSGFTSETYVLAAMKQIYGNRKAEPVRIHGRDDLLTKWIPAMREPGADESEAA